MLKKIFSISLAPFCNAHRAGIALKQIYKIRWYKNIVQKIPDRVQKFFGEYFPGKKLFLTGSGREAFYAILKQLDLKPGAEVVLQSFTCVVLPNAVQSCGLKVRWIDLDKDTLNIDLAALEQMLQSGSVSVVVTQDTFGIPADRDEMMRLKKKYQFYWIEDLAHSFGNSYRGGKLGNFGDFAFLSFGRDKMFSGVSGGLIVSSEPVNPVTLPWKTGEIFQYLFYELIMPFVKILPALLAKPFVAMMFGIGLLPKTVSSGERQGVKYPGVRGFPELFEPFLEYEMDHWVQNIESRRENARLWREMLSGYSEITGFNLPPDLILLRYPVKIPEVVEFLNFTFDKNIYVGDWYRNGIDPKGTVWEKFGYDASLFPNTVEIAVNIFNLPLYSWLQPEHFKLIDNVIKDYLAKKLENKTAGA